MKKFQVILLMLEVDQRSSHPFSMMLRVATLHDLSILSSIFQGMPLQQTVQVLEVQPGAHPVCHQVAVTTS